MDKKDNDTRAEETRAREARAKEARDQESQAKETGAGTSARAGKTSASSNASTSSGTASDKNDGQSPGDKDETGQDDARKPAASKPTARKPTAKGGSKTDSKPAAGKSGDSATVGGDKTAGDRPKSSAATGTSKPDASADETSRGEDATGDGTPAGGAKATVSADRPRRSATPWLVIGLLVLFALAAVGGWQLWQVQRTLQSQASEQDALGDELEQEVMRLNDELGSTRSAVAALEDRGEAIREQIESGLQARLADLADRQDRLAERIARIDDRLSRGEIAWKTAEIGFLITRAQERLTIGRDPDGAMLALRLADQRVAALSRPHWLPLRSAISDAIAEIEATGEGDRVGQALALRRLTDRVEDWPLVDEADRGDGEPAEAAVGPDDAGGSGESLPQDAAWYEKAWAATRGWIAGQISVTRSDTPTRLRERVATDREMRLWLTAVRESLLSRDPNALSTTLEEARDWLESHYATDADGPARALEALERTRERFASRDFPSIDAVLDAWERANAREKARADATAETGEEDPS